MEHFSLKQPGLQAFLSQLAARFGGDLEALLEKRKSRSSLQHPAREAIRAGSWKVAPIPTLLQKRYVEITGPAEPKMIINALASGADGFMADLEDAFTPHPQKVLEAHQALFDAVRNRLVYKTPQKVYVQDPTSPTFLHVRPRGLHLVEKRLWLHPYPASFFDAAVFLFFNAEALLASGRFPSLYLPKLESAEEARLWHEVLTYCEAQLGLPLGSVRVSILVETLPAACQTEEILYELRDRATALNAGRWDYLFSISKYLIAQGKRPLPPRHLLSMETPFMEAYALEIVRAAHQRGALAIGGMSAFIPSRKEPALNERALSAVQEDKTLEIARGFDGAWVAHPDLVPVIQTTFATKLSGRPNQISTTPTPSKEALLRFPEIDSSELTEAVLLGQMEVALLYLTSWLQGQGAVAIFNLMEDAATAEIARTQLYHWLHQREPLKLNGEPLSIRLYEELLAKAREKHPSISSQAARLLQDLLYSPDFIPFLTNYAYDRYLLEEAL